ncbi:MAG TPA: 30S ribosomal protein S1 [Acidobacteriaceae bacterium]|nr:30S ribosomal protein S1 [Acidobacteriaceae bacterium]
MSDFKAPSESPSANETTSSPAQAEREESQPEREESFDALLAQYERRHNLAPETAGKQLQGAVIAVSADQIFLDIGFKVEGVLPVAALAGQQVKLGDVLPVTVKGRNEEGYYELSRLKIAQPTDWASLEEAFAAKTAVLGRVTSVVKGGLSVDVGVRAFLPASRSGTRDAAEMEKLVGQEIRCRITKLDSTEEDVVVDRRALLEEEERSTKERRFTELREGETVQGEVRSIAPYGAFVDIGGVDGLLHVGDISWARVNSPSDVLSVGQKIESKILRIDTEKRRISLGLKQLQPDPWSAAAGKYKTGEKIRGTVTRVAEFGAFVEVEPGIEGLIHLSEMSWTRKVKKPGDILKPGDTVEAVVLGVNATEKRLSLGLKQALGDPWAAAAEQLVPGAIVEGPVTSLTKFGAFVQVAEGVEGMIHISEISAEKHIHHPQEVLKPGQVVRVQVLEANREKRQLRLSMKKLVPVSLDEYIAEHRAGDVVSGRAVDVNGGAARVELGEGIEGLCRLAAGTTDAAGNEAAAGKADLSALTSMLQARWKGGSGSQPAKAEPLRAGQIRSFRIAKLDPGAKTIELELA